MTTERKITKAIARCKELIAQRDSEAMLKFFDEESSVTLLD